MKKHTTPAQVNSALKRLGIKGSIIRNQRGGCYYYFIGDLFDVVPSIYSYNLDGKSTGDVVEYVQHHLLAADAEAYKEAYRNAHAYLQELEAKESFEHGSLTDGHQFEKSRIRQRIFKHMIKAKCEQGKLPEWWEQAVIAATTVDEYYNNFKEWI